MVAGCGSQARPVEPAAAPVVRDIHALVRADLAGDSDEAVSALYALLAAARSQPGDREGWKGMTLVRRRLPAIVARFLAAYPTTRRRLESVRTRTDGGDALRAWLLAADADQRRFLLSLRADVAKAGYGWGAVLRWTLRNDEAIARSNRQLNAILRRLPPAERHAAETAIAQALGRS